VRGIRFTAQTTAEAVAERAEVRACVRDAFEKEMDAAGADWQMLTFSGILHAFTDQGADVPGVAGWDEPTTRQTYALTHQFIADAFAGKL